MREPSHVKHHTWVRLTCLCALAVSSTLWATHARAFKIVAPANGTTLTSGQPTAAEVEAGREAGLVEVRYYWYPEQTEALVEQGEERAGKASQSGMATEKYWQKDSITGAPVVALPALTSTVDRVPPYGGQLPVPPDAIGRMRLLAIADISQGRLGRKTVFDEVFVTVQPKADLLSIDFETEKPLQLGRTGPVFMIVTKILPRSAAITERLP